MRIAILLLVHKNKTQLERLLSVLKHDNIDVFVHVDKKCSFDPADVQTSTNVIFTEKRYDIGLFEFSMIDAEIELIRTAKRYGTYGYFVLMSAQCYPIHSIEYIYNYLSNAYPKPFVMINAPSGHKYVNKIFRHVYVLKRFKLRTYASLKKKFSDKVFRKLKYIPGGIAHIVSRIKELFCGSPKERLTKLNYSTYCGSQWWILPDNITDNVLKEYENKAFCKAISDAFSCDESFFQTAIMKNAEENGIVVDEQGDYSHPKWFYIFDGGHPITLTKEYYDQIVSSGMLFARKFDVTVDSEIFDMIDEKIKKEG